MTKKYFAEESRPFEPAKSKHIGHIGSGPKSGQKRAVNLSVNAEILKVAKEMKINLSQVLEDTLRKATADECARRFYEENKAFIDWHNELVEKHGTLAEALYELENDDQAI